jgi:hypothetical protein
VRGNLSEKRGDQGRQPSVPQAELLETTP